MEKFNTELDDAQRERLALLSEECGEVVQVIGKILRHGYESSSPYTDTTNRSLLEKELGDVQFVIELMLSRRDLDQWSIREHVANKARKIDNYLHFNTVIEAVQGRTMSSIKEDIQRLNAEVSKDGPVVAAHKERDGRIQWEAREAALDTEVKDEQKR